jgi:ectoine hydroxylase-related dioxygenase (phytanoyl-CoA dioxygenase family)
MVTRTTDALDRDGYAPSHAVVDGRTVDALTDAISAAADGPGGGGDPVAARRRRGERVYAMRNLMRLVPAVRALAVSSVLRRVVEPVVGPGARVVRALLFDKTPAANWKVAWHQDLSIAVRARRDDAPGYGPWSAKAGVVHVQPPVAVLERMLTVRLNLDDCGDASGPLLVLPGSHAHGVLPPDAVARWRRTVAPAACTGRRGDAVLMRPLTLHASSPATDPRHRRVVHLEYAAGDLPGGVDWYEDE